MLSKPALETRDSNYPACILPNLLDILLASVRRQALRPLLPSNSALAQILHEVDDLVERADDLGGGVAFTAVGEISTRSGRR